MNSNAAACLWETPLGSFSLSRYPPATDDTQLAWSAADSLLVAEVCRREVPGNDVLVVNDAHGALCVALQPRALWTDSFLSQLALVHNAQRNQISTTPVTWSTDCPLSTISSNVQLVVMRIPKQLAYFEYQLAQLARALPSGAEILAAGMDKHLSPHTASLLERYIGPTQRHPGKRKARVFCARRDSRPPEPDAPPAEYFFAPLGEKLQGMPNVFSREKLDLGSRFLLEQLPRLAPAQTVIDLACGNGVLGLTAFKQGLAATVVFCDESALAIRSTQLNAQRCFPDSAGSFGYHHGDGLLNYTGLPAQLIICNPPFHYEHTVDALVGRRLLQQCKNHLAPDGRLCVVANRHLEYRAGLLRHFGRVEQVAVNSKFRILLAHNA